MASSNRRLPRGPDVARLFEQFPAPGLLAVAGANLAMAHVGDADDLLLLLAAWIGTLAAALFFQERRGAFQGFVAQIVAGAVAVVLMRLAPSTELAQASMISGLALLCLAAPVARLKNPDSYWAWVRAFGLAGGFAFAIALAGFAATVATLTSANALFGPFFNTPTLIHDSAALFFLGVGPVAFLMVQPQIVEDTPEATIPDAPTTRISVLAAWAFTPFVLAYSALLWLYAGKIALRRALPNGEIGWMVGVFGVATVVTVFLIAPQRREGPPPARLLWAVWPYLAVAPILLLALAVAERIAAYGLTPDRYMALAMDGLLAATAAVALCAREAVLRFVPAAGALTLILASVGPWGAAAVSARWQRATLAEIYESYERLADGRLSDGAPALSNEEKRRCEAAADFLRETEPEALSPWLSGEDLRKRYFIEVDCAGPRVTLGIGEPPTPEHGGP